jgi:hemerythrin superfamily protein
MVERRKDDVLGVLISQHDEIKDLFHKVAQAGGKQRREFFADLVRLLAVHQAAEEEVVHPIARKEIDDGDDVVENRLREEQEARDALTELHDLGADHPEFASKLLALAAAITAHATYEEDEEFRFLRERVPPTLLQQMAGAVQAAQAEVPGNVPPERVDATAPPREGRPVAIFERVQGAVREWRLRNG